MRLPESVPVGADAQPIGTVNRTELTGRVVERGSLRYTPAGVPVIEFRLSHASAQIEVATLRQVECELPCVVLGPTALLLKEVAPGTILTASGFLAARSLKQKAPVLHVRKIEFAEII